VDLAVLVLAALDSVDPVVLVAAHPALVALVSVALINRRRQLWEPQP
jgi:hypothetical protein